ncbi:MAG: hypothetical protein IPK13_24865 [Deltaproteobacteria bacterium]|nr:hypothetical protein [Deltaproteobacteria bacterium]
MGSCLLTLAACKQTPPGSQGSGEGPGSTATSITHDVFNRVKRLDFNQTATLLNVPIFWREDANENGILEPAELAVIWGFGTPRAVFVAGDHFTPEFASAYAAIEAKLASNARDDNGRTDADAAHANANAKANATDDAAVAKATANAADAKATGDHASADVETERRQLVEQELNQGRTTLVYSDFQDASPEDKRIVRAVLEAAAIIERIFARQNGVTELGAQIPPDDLSSRMLFFRNQGPWCVAPKTESSPRCNALSTFPAKRSGLYPLALQEDSKFCEALAGRKNADALFDPFVVVEQRGDDLVPVPYTEAYAADMKAVSDKLIEASQATGDGEEAFHAYLVAAAQAFLDNNWPSADEAWAAMSATNSKWYLRIGPDEVYFEPCSRKGGFHVSFARINRDSLKWQEKLDPSKSDMEAAITMAAGRPYKARKVDFKLPDFIDIIVNAGDSRAAHGGTIGQSLPNWGPVANEGRGRTVAMTNLYTDHDSLSALKEQAASLLCEATMATFTTDPEPQLLSTVLHEAAHNLGPSHQYKVAGKTASQIFGGPLASTLEELKAQTAALFFIDWLRGRQLIDETMAIQAHTRDLVWAFGHIAQGMYTATHEPKNYSQLAAIQLGFLSTQGAIEWKAKATAANGTDPGCFEIRREKFAGAVKQMMSVVGGIKARGDKRKAKSLIDQFVDTKGTHAQRMNVIRERWLRSPKSSFVYTVDL